MLLIRLCLGSHVGFLVIVVQIIAQDLLAILVRLEDARVAVWRVSAMVEERTESNTNR